MSKMLGLFATKVGAKELTLALTLTLTLTLALALTLTLTLTCSPRRWVPRRQRTTNSSMCAEPRP